MTAEIKARWLSKATYIPALATFFLGVLVTAWTDALINGQSIKQLTQEVAALNVTIDNMNRKRDQDHDNINSNTVRLTALETEFTFFKQINR